MKGRESQMFQALSKTTQGLWNSFSSQHPNLLFSSTFYSKTNSLFFFSFFLFLLFSFFFSQLPFSIFVFSFLWDFLFLTLFLYTTSFDFLNFFSSFVFCFSSNLFFHLHNSKLLYPHTCISQTHRTQRTWEVTIVVSLILGTKGG